MQYTKVTVDTVTFHLTLYVEVLYKVCETVNVV